MQVSKLVTDGSARDEALKRRNDAMREALRREPARAPGVDRPQKPNSDEKPGE